MNKKGFTLVELLAVIAILAILVIIALPNVMSLFNEAKKNSFANEIKEIYKTAQQQWMTDSMGSTGSKVYARDSITCNGLTSTQLQLSGRTQLKYAITINKAGKVTNYVATDGTFMYRYSGDGLEIEEIGSTTTLAQTNPENTTNMIISLTDVNKSNATISCQSNAIVVTAS